MCGGVLWTGTNRTTYICYHCSFWLRKAPDETMRGRDDATPHCPPVVQSDYSDLRYGRRGTLRKYAFIVPTFFGPLTQRLRDLSIGFIEAIG